MITDQKVEKALTYLAETDAQGAEAIKQVYLGEEALKILEAQAGLQATTGPEQSKAKNQCRASDKYRETIIKLAEAKAQAALIRNKRETAQEIIRVYQTQSSNRRQGNI